MPGVSVIVAPDNLVSVVARAHRRGRTRGQRIGDDWAIHDWVGVEVDSFSELPAGGEDRAGGQHRVAGARQPLRMLRVGLHGAKLRGDARIGLQINRSLGFHV
jgi:hypothetical protein